MINNAGIEKIDKKAPIIEIPKDTKYAHLLKEIKPHPRNINRLAIIRIIIKATGEFLKPGNNEKK